MHNEASLRNLFVAAAELIVSPTSPGFYARLESLCANLEEEAPLGFAIAQADFRAPGALCGRSFFGFVAQLPNVVASHFNARGAANGWQTKQAFFTVFVGVTVLCVLLGFGMASLIGAMPMSLINLPNKQYWLALEHRDETLDWLKAYFGWFACGLYVLMIVTYDYAAQSNLHPDHPPSVARLIYTLVGFLAFVVVWLVRMFSRFSRVPEKTQVS